MYTLILGLNSIHKPFEESTTCGTEPLKVFFKPYKLLTTTTLLIIHFIQMVPVKTLNSASLSFICIEWVRSCRRGGFVKSEFLVLLLLKNTKSHDE